MQISFRYGLVGGLMVALFAGTVLIRLWQPERQVQLHTEHLLRAIEGHDWNRVQGFVAPGYHDQWDHDRATLIDRMRQVLHFVRSPQFRSSDVNVQADGHNGTWSG